MIDCRMRPRRRSDGAERVITRCSRCHAPMRCEPQGDCWCKRMPSLPNPDLAQGCYCESCLRSAIEESGRDQRTAARDKAP